MKKLSLLLVFVMFLTVFVACDNKTTKEEEPAETPVETAEETETEEEVVEETEAEKEEETEETTEEAPAKEVGEIAKIGLGNFTSTTKSKDKADDKPAAAQADVTVAAVAFDADGKIVDVKIDVAQTKAEFNEDNTNAVLDEVDYRTKIDKGPDYGMLKNSPIKKEYFEQMAAFEEYLIGMTAEEVANIPTKVANEDHQNVPDVAELASTVTIDIAKYQQVVQEAWDNAVDATGATKLGLGLIAHGKATEAGDKPAQIQFDTYMSAMGFDDEGKIIANCIDVVQPKIPVSAEGVVEASEDVKSKKELKEEYDMKKNSEIGKEWYEQMEAWQEFTIGKTLEEVQGIPVKERDEKHKNVPDLPELASTVTITVEGYQEVMADAFDNANK